ncbi:MAG: DUF3109 family protein [Bacteroidetes bacterium]|nr:DUF3109 family protein [Bacteroidota bacterium]
MVIVGNALVSEEILERKFACQLGQCHGACCVQGDLGAPLEEEEVQILEQEMHHFMPFLSEEGKAEIALRGYAEQDPEGEWVTVCRPTGECVFVNYDGAVAVCGIEKAWQAGKTWFRKPLSCHLYPIRAKKYGEYVALNYHNWSICAPACKAGEELKVPVHHFLREALVRKMGPSWYKELEAVASDWPANQK